MPSNEGFDASVHLTRQDIAIDDPCQPQVIRVHIKQSKTDPFRKGISLFIGKTGTGLCPVAAMLGYLLWHDVPSFQAVAGAVLIIGSGVYIIHIDAGDAGEKIVKWFGALRPVDLNAF